MVHKTQSQKLIGLPITVSKKKKIAEPLVKVKTELPY